MRRALAVVASAGLALAAGVVMPAAQPAPLFTFHSNAWLNLHHYIRAGARGGPGPESLSAAESAVWSAGVAVYKPYATRDVLFDDGMVSIKNALREAEGRDTLTGVDVPVELRDTLERVMPVYRQHAWPAHDRANRDWIAAVLPLIERHGRPLAAAVAGAYEVRWPDQPVPVDVSVIAGPVGAYTTNGPTHVTISSTDAGYRGYAALEMLFHESSHGWNVLYQAVADTAKAQGAQIPSGLWHGVLFFNAGELTVRELARHGVTYRPYAKAELYTNLCGAGCFEKVAAHWTPHLDGRGDFRSAIRSLVASFPPARLPAPPRGNGTERTGA